MAKLSTWMAGDGCAAVGKIGARRRAPLPSFKSYSFHFRLPNGELGRVDVKWMSRRAWNRGDWIEPKDRRGWADLPVGWMVIAVRLTV